MRRRSQASIAFPRHRWSTSLAKPRLSDYEHANGSKIAPAFAGTKSAHKFFLATEALPSEARHETRIGVVCPGFGCRFRTQYANSLRPRLRRSIAGKPTIAVRSMR